MMKALNKVKNFFSKKHPKTQFIYAVTAGAYLGELLVYIEESDSSYNFLTLPDMTARQIPTDKFDMGLENSIVEAVEKLPTFVYKTCITQYKKNKGGTNNK